MLVLPLSPSASLNRAASLFVSLHLIRLSALMPSFLRRFSHKNQILRLENRAPGVLSVEELGDELWLTAGLGIP